MFTALSEQMTGVLNRLRGRGVLSEGDVTEALREIRRHLLEADVSFEVTRGFDEQRADGPLAYPLDKAPRDFETHVRLEQVAADFAQGFGDVALRKDAAARETLQHGGELLG